MPFRTLRPPAALAAGLLTLALAPAAGAVELITNGGFEADAGLIQSPDPFTAWTAAEHGLIGGVAIAQGTSAPSSGRATVGAAAGSQYGVLDLASPSRMAISQRFTVGAAPVRAATLSFQWFASYGGTETAFITQPNDLAYGRFAPVLTLRVDILKDGAPAFGTAAGDLVFSGVFSAPLADGGQPYINFSRSFDGLVAGESYSLRFAAASNRAPLVVGIDEVSLDVQSVPEPETWALMATGLALFGFAARRRG